MSERDVRHKSGGESGENKRVKLGDRVPFKCELTQINEYLICQLCFGYLVQPTAIIECHHTFCKSCILKYLDTNTYCPVCEVQLNEAKPLLSLRSDEILESLVYKLVPNLVRSELRRRREFEKTKENSNSENNLKESDSVEETGVSKNNDEFFGISVAESYAFLSPDDSVSLSLQYYKKSANEEGGGGDEESSRNKKERGEKDKKNQKSITTTTTLLPTTKETNNNDESHLLSVSTDSNQKANDRRYLQCPAAVSVALLKKFIRNKYGLSDDYRVDLLYDGEEENNLENDLTLLDLSFIYKWKRGTPMCFHYRIFDKSVKMSPSRLPSQKLKIVQEPPHPPPSPSSPNFHPPPNSKQNLNNNSPSNAKNVNNSSNSSTKSASSPPKNDKSTEKIEKNERNDDKNDDKVDKNRKNERKMSSSTNSSTSSSSSSTSPLKISIKTTHKHHKKHSKKQKSKDREREREKERYKYNAHPNPTQSQVISFHKRHKNEFIKPEKSEKVEKSEKAEKIEKNNEKTVEKSLQQSLFSSSKEITITKNEPKSRDMSKISENSRTSPEITISKEQQQGTKINSFKIESSHKNGKMGESTIMHKNLKTSYDFQVPKSVTLIPVTPGSELKIKTPSNSTSISRGANTFTHPITNKSLHQITVTEVPPPKKQQQLPSSCNQNNNLGNNVITIEKCGANNSVQIPNSLSNLQSNFQNKEFNGPGSMEITKIYCDSSKQSKKLKNLDISITPSGMKNNCESEKNYGKFLPKIPGVSIHLQPKVEEKREKIEEGKRKKSFSSSSSNSSLSPQNAKKPRLELSASGEKPLDLSGSHKKDEKILANQRREEVKAQPNNKREEVKVQPNHRREEVKVQPNHKREEIKAQPIHKREEVKVQPNHKREEIKVQPNHKREEVKVQPNQKRDEMKISANQSREEKMTSNQKREEVKSQPSKTSSSIHSIAESLALKQVHKSSSSPKLPIYPQSYQNANYAQFGNYPSNISPPIHSPPPYLHPLNNLLTLSNAAASARKINHHLNNSPPLANNSSQLTPQSLLHHFSNFNNAPHGLHNYNLGQLQRPIYNNSPQISPPVPQNPAFFNSGKKYGNLTKTGKNPNPPPSNGHRRIIDEKNLRKVEEKGVKLNKSEEKPKSSFSFGISNFLPKEKDKVDNPNAQAIITSNCAIETNSSLNNSKLGDFGIALGLVPSNNFQNSEKVETLEKSPNFTPISTSVSPKIINESVRRIPNASLIGTKRGNSEKIGQDSFENNMKLWIDRYQKLEIEKKRRREDEICVEVDKKVEEKNEKELESDEKCKVLNAQNEKIELIKAKTPEIRIEERKISAEIDENVKNIEKEDEKTEDENESQMETENIKIVKTLENEAQISKTLANNLEVDEDESVREKGGNENENKFLVEKEEEEIEIEIDSNTQEKSEEMNILVMLEKTKKCEKEEKVMILANNEQHEEKEKNEIESKDESGLKVEKNEEKGEVECNNDENLYLKRDENDAEVDDEEDQLFIDEEKIIVIDLEKELVPPPPIFSQLQQKKTLKSPPHHLYTPKSPAIIVSEIPSKDSLNYQNTQLIDTVSESIVPSGQISENIGQTVQNVENNGQNSQKALVLENIVQKVLNFEKDSKIEEDFDKETVQNSQKAPIFESIMQKSPNYEKNTGQNPQKGPILEKIVPKTPNFENVEKDATLAEEVGILVQNLLTQIVSKEVEEEEENFYKNSSDDENLAKVEMCYEEEEESPNYFEEEIEDSALNFQFISDFQTPQTKVLSENNNLNEGHVE